MSIKAPYILLILFFHSLNLKGRVKDPLSGHLTISGAFALYPMMVVWANAFEKLYPAVHIDISAGGTGKGITDVLSGMSDIGMVSREVNAQEYQKGAYPITVTRDAVVPTISSANPNLHLILLHGLKRKDLQNVWVEGKTITWGQVLGSQSHIPIRRIPVQMPAVLPKAGPNSWVFSRKIFQGLACIRIQV